MGMPAAVLDHFSSIFGDRRGLPKCLHERRRIEDPRTDASLLEVLTGGAGLSPGESLLIAGDLASGKSSICHQILAHLIDQGHGCLMVSPSRASSLLASRQVKHLSNCKGGNLLRTFFTEDEKDTLVRLLGQVGAYSFVCVDGLDELVSGARAPATALASLMNEARKQSTGLIVVKRTKSKADSNLGWRRLLQEDVLLSAPNHVGAVTREGSGVLSWECDRGGEQEITPLYFNVQTNAVSPWSSWH